jgi:DNA polymerase-1
MEKQLNIYYVGNDENLKKSYIPATIENCHNYLKTKQLISLDIETSYKFGGRYKKYKEGLDPYLSNIVMLQIGDINRQYVIDYRDINISMLYPILTDKNIIKVGHNIKFEYKHLYHNDGIRLNNIYDTMVVEQILYNGLGKSNSLKALNQRYLNKDVDKDTRLEFSHIGNRPFTEKQINYGAEDVLYPLLIREQQLTAIDNKDVNNCVRLEMLFTLVLGDIEYKGMNFNQGLWLDNYEKNKIIYEDKIEILNNFVLDNYFDTDFVSKQFDLFTPDFYCSIQWTSPTQVVKFFRFLGICPKEKGKYTSEAKVVKASLKTINKNIDEKLKQFLKDYLSYKKYHQACTTFGKKFLKHVNPVTKRLHSSYKQIVTTGRISSSNPNLQNIPAKHGFRSAFDAPKGWKIVNADYSGQEQIILANKSKDKDLIYFYQQGFGDMHSYIASKIYPEISNLSLEDIKKLHPDKRQIAKSAGFAINYGGTGFTIAGNLGVSQQQGDDVYNAYFKAFPGLKKYFDITISNTFRRGYILIDELTGRKCWFEPPKTGQEKGSIARTALNYPIQGEAGGITKYAPILFRKWILDNNLEDYIFITNLVHDEINVEVKEGYLELAAENLERCMKESGDKWCKIVPLTASAVITDFWNH